MKLSEYSNLGKALKLAAPGKWDDVPDDVVGLAADRMSNRPGIFDTAESINRHTEEVTANLNLANVQLFGLPKLFEARETEILDHELHRSTTDYNIKITDEAASRSLTLETHQAVRLEEEKTKLLIWAEAEKLKLRVKEKAELDRLELQRQEEEKKIHLRMLEAAKQIEMKYSKE